jgi:predicted Zn-ribbon and HTH transcriptional regulator
MSEYDKCPKCNSDRITEVGTHDITVEINVKTGKVIYREKNPERNITTIWFYRCRKCGWESDCFCE